MDRLALSGVCILVHDQDDGSSVGFDECAGSDNTDIGDPVVVDSFNVDCTVRVDANDADVVSCNSTVGSAVNE
jgi:hypothetical protein